MMGGKVLVARMEICRECFALRGPFFDAHNGCERVQRCGCERREPLWNAFDYNCAAELCQCCAWRILRSGSKWSAFFCGPCGGPIRAYNQAAGVAVVPIGRHSIMNGIALSGENGKSRRARSAFVRALPDWIDRTSRLWRYHRAHVARIVGSIDATGTTLPLSQYIERARRDRASTTEAFAAVVRAVTKKPDATRGSA
jgi:hypothetical protein